MPLIVLMAALHQSFAMLRVMLRVGVLSAEMGAWAQRMAAGSAAGDGRKVRSSSRRPSQFITKRTQVQGRMASAR